MNLWDAKVKKLKISINAVEKCQKCSFKNDFNPIFCSAEDEKLTFFASGCDFMVEAWNYINYAGKMVICIVMKKRKKEYNGRADNEFSSMGRWTKAAIRPGLWNLDTLAIIKNTKCGGIMIWSLMDIFNSKHNEQLFNYVDQIMANIDHLPTPGWHWRRNLFCS